MSEGTSETNNRVDMAEEPSMEDILASIRKLIADDDESAPEGETGIDAHSVDTSTIADEPIDNKEPLDLDNILFEEVTSESETGRDFDNMISEISDELSGKTGATSSQNSSNSDVVETSFGAKVNVEDDEISSLLDNLLEDGGLLGADDVALTKDQDDEVITDHSDDVLANTQATHDADSLFDDIISDNMSVFGAETTSSEIPVEPSAGTLEESTEAQDKTDVDNIDDQIDMLLAKLDGKLTAPSQETHAREVEAAPADQLDAVSDDILADLLSEIDGDSQTDAPQEIGALNEMESNEADMAGMSDDAFDIDSLLDNMEAGVEIKADEDIVSDIISTDSSVPDKVPATEVDPDIELVKSLMADLTEPNMGEVTSEPAQEVTVLDDVLLDTLASEEQLQTVKPQEATEVGTKSALSALADALEDANSTDDAKTNMALIAGAAAATTVSAQGPLMAMMSDDNEEAEAGISDLERIIVAETPRLSGDEGPGDVSDSLEDVDAKPAQTEITEAVTSDDDQMIEDVLANMIGEDALPDDTRDDNTSKDDILAGLVVEADVSVETPEQGLVNNTNNDLTHTQKELEAMAVKKVKDTILSEVTEDAAASAFAQLNQAVDQKNLKAERGDRIGDLVMEVLEPMLKEWLDKNLKTIVERAVQKEVKRISSGK